MIPAILQRNPRLSAIGLVAVLVAVAGSSSLTAQVLPIDLTVAFGGGGAWVDGDEARYQKHYSLRADGYGGVFDFSRRKVIDGGFVAVEGAFLAGNAEGLLDLRWEKFDSHYFNVGFRQFRTWYDGSGAWYPAGDTWITLYDDAMAVDRSRLWAEFGIIPRGKPHLVLRYEHRRRSGNKDSTRLGDTTLTDGNGTKSVVPTYLDLDETRDILTADLTSRNAERAWEIGVRYDRSELDNSRNATRNPDESAERTVVTRDQTASDLFSAHAYTMQRLHEKLTFSVGGSYMTLDSSLDGSRIYGEDFDPVFDPDLGSLRYKDAGYLDLIGDARRKQFEGNLNLLYQPAKHWRIRFAFRGEDISRESVSSFAEWAVSASRRTTVTDMAAASQRDIQNFNESVELRFTGLKKWTFDLRGEWYQGDGDLFEQKHEIETDKVLVDRLTDDKRDYGRYSLTSNWYPVGGLTFSAGAAYWIRNNSYAHLVDSSPANRLDRYPAYIVGQEFKTLDFNLRMSWRVNPKLSLVSRIDVRNSDVNSQMEELAQVKSGEWESRIFSQNITWSPLAQLYLVLNLNLVRDVGRVPGTDVVAESTNDYSVGTFSAGWAVDERNDLVFDYALYDTDNFTSPSPRVQPYGASERRHHAALTWGFHYADDLLFKIRYAQTSNRDLASGGHNDYDARSVYLNIQYSF